MGLHREPEVLQAEIVRGTLHLIASGGMTNFSYPKLTEATGISAPTVYEHYKNKEDLLVTCYLTIDREIGELLAAVLSNAPPHRNEPEAIADYCWLLWSAYWQYLMAVPDRTLFCWAFYNSPYYTEKIRQRRERNYPEFSNFVAYHDRKFHVSERYDLMVLMTNLIDGTIAAAIKVIRNEYDNSALTIRTIYQMILRPVFAALDLSFEADSHKGG